MTPSPLDAVALAIAENCEQYEETFQRAAQAAIEAFAAWAEKQNTGEQTDFDNALMDIRTEPVADMWSNFADAIRAGAKE